MGNEIGVDANEEIGQGAVSDAAVAAAKAACDAAAAADERLEALVAGHDVSDARRESLAIAIRLGADAATLERLRDARRISQGPSVLLPLGRYEHLSRGRGWARRGKGATVQWGEREDGGYRVGPGRWEVGSSDGYHRKSKETWTVAHVALGGQTWTVAS